MNLIPATCAERLKKTGVRVLLESNMFGLSDQLSFVESPDCILFH